MPSLRFLPNAVDLADAALLEEQDAATATTLTITSGGDDGGGGDDGSGQLLLGDGGGDGAGDDAGGGGGGGDGGDGGGWKTTKSKKKKKKAPWLRDPPAPPAARAAPSTPPPRAGAAATTAPPPSAGAPMPAEAVLRSDIAQATMTLLVSYSWRVGGRGSQPETNLPTHRTSAPRCAMPPSLRPSLRTWRKVPQTRCSSHSAWTGCLTRARCSKKFTPSAAAWAASRLSACGCTSTRKQDRSRSVVEASCSRLPLPPFPSPPSAATDTDATTTPQGSCHIVFRNPDELEPFLYEISRGLKTQHKVMLFERPVRNAERAASNKTMRRSARPDNRIDVAKLAIARYAE